MPLVSMRQLLDEAAKGGYGVGAFNVNNMEQIQSIMEAARETKSPVIVQATMDMGAALVTASSLSFIGLGVQPPGSSIGLMIFEGSQAINSHPWEALVPCIILAIIVLAFSFFGDGLRDAFDPRSKD